MPDLHWLTAEHGRLALSARPRGGDWLEDHLRGWRQAGVETVVSLLTEAEQRELELTGEARICATLDMSFRSFPIPDRGLPTSDREVLALIADLATLVSAGQSILLHCRMGIGRTGMIAAAVLVWRGFTADTALEAAAIARGLAIPDTLEQADWVRRFSTRATP
ncbi:MAG: protein-tyrosine phosphatase family protein [Planctomycetota bacterium]